MGTFDSLINGTAPTTTFGALTSGVAASISAVLAALAQEINALGVTVTLPNRTTLAALMTTDIQALEHRGIVGQGISTDAKFVLIFDGVAKSQIGPDQNVTVDGKNYKILPPLHPCYIGNQCSTVAAACVKF